jgi:hypothetical protein
LFAMTYRHYFPSGRRRGALLLRRDKPAINQTHDRK